MNLLFINYIVCCFYFLIWYVFNNTAYASSNAKKISNLFVLVTFLQLLYIHSTVDINSVPDLASYSNDYNNYARMSLQEMFQNYRTTEYLYLLFIKIVLIVSDDFRFFLLVYNIILFFSYYFSFKNLSPVVPVSIMMFLLISYNQSIFVLRQHLAISVLLYSIPFILKKKPIKFFLISCSAFFIHHSSIMWMPIYLLTNNKDKGRYLLSLLAYVFLFQLVASNLTFFSSYDDRIDFYQDAVLMKSGTSLTIIFIEFSYLISFIWFLRKHIFDQGINQLITTMLVVACAGYIFAPSITLVDRLLLYFQVIVIFSVPVTMTYIKLSLIRFVYIIGILILQGFITLSLLKMDYYSQFDITEISIIYILLIVIMGLFVYTIFSKDNRRQNIQKVSTKH